MIAFLVWLEVEGTGQSLGISPIISPWSKVLWERWDGDTTPCTTRGLLLVIWGARRGLLSTDKLAPVKCFLFVFSYNLPKTIYFISLKINEAHILRGQLEKQKRSEDSFSAILKNKPSLWLSYFHDFSSGCLRQCTSSIQNKHQSFLSSRNLLQYHLNWVTM